MAPEPKVSREVLSPNRSGRAGAAIDHIVIHYTTSRNIKGALDHFQTGTPKVSAHYVIGQDGELVRVVPDEWAAWHAGNSVMNRRSIGIEHCAAPGDKITPEQERTSAALIRWLADKHRIPRANIIPHVAVKSTSCPGDLFAAYGGQAGADAKTQGAALSKWLAARVFTTEPDTTEVAMTDAPIPTAPAPVPAQPASQSLSIWGMIAAAIVPVIPPLTSQLGFPVTIEQVVSLTGIIMMIADRLGARTRLTLR